LTQIIEVYRLKSTGSLALITFALTVIGNVARITTILFEAKIDYKFLISIVSVALLNFYIVLQFYLYRNAKPIKKDEKKD
jgi:hypothetical protein